MKKSSGLTKKIRGNTDIRTIARHTKDIAKVVCSDQNFWINGIGCPPPSMFYHSIHHLYNSRRHKKEHYE